MFSLFGGQVETNTAKPDFGSGTAAMKAQLSMLRKQLKRTNADMESVIGERIKVATRKLQDQNTELVGALTAARNEASKARQAEHDAKDSLVALHASTGDAEADLRQQLEEARTDVMDSRVRLERACARAKASASRPDVDGEAEGLRAQLAAAHGNVAALQAMRRKLEADLHAATTELAEQRPKATKSSAELKSFRIKVRILEEERRVLAAKAEREESVNHRLIAAIEAQRAELCTGRQATAQLSKVQGMLRQAKDEAAGARKAMERERAAALQARDEAADAAKRAAEAIESRGKAMRTTRKSVAAVRSLRRASVAAGHGDPLTGLDARMRRRLTACGVDEEGEGPADEDAGSGLGGLEDDDDAMSDGGMSDESDVLDLDETDAACGVLGPEEDQEGGGMLSPSRHGSTAQGGAANASASRAAMESLRDRLATALDAKATSEAAANAARAELEAREARVVALQAEVEEAAAAREEVAAEAAAAREELSRSQAARQVLVQDLIDAKGSLRVIARVRPMAVAGGRGEGGEGAVEAVTVLGDDRVRVRAPAEGGKAGNEKTFGFNRAFGPSSTQDEVFSELRPIVEGVMGGTSAVIFAYGQTGAGKTHTMQGREGQEGVTPRSVRCILEGCESRRAEMGRDGGECDVSVGILEIYRESLRDLLADTEDGEARGSAAPAPAIRQEAGGRVFVDGLTYASVRTADEAAGVMASGLSRRAVSATAMNADSSRSHLVTLVRFSSADSSTGVTTSASLFLVDLAGSERLKKSEAVGTQRSEAQSINKSLSALGDVLSALQARSAHVPFRNSKLTHLLMSALAPGGGCRATMIVQVSPAEANCPETTCSLAFGKRAASIELGKATRGVDSGSGGSGTAGTGGPGAAGGKRSEERLARAEASLKKERAARAQAEEELALARRQARSLRSLVAANRGTRAGAAGGRARTLGASSAGREDRTSVESTMEASMDWLPAAMPEQAVGADEEGAEERAAAAGEGDAADDSAVDGFRPRPAPRSARKQPASDGAGRCVPPKTPMRVPGSAARRAGRTKTPSRFGGDAGARSNAAPSASAPKTPTRSARSGAAAAAKTPTAKSSMKRRIRAVTSRIDTGRTPSRSRATADVPDADGAVPPSTPFRV